MTTPQTLFGLPVVMSDDVAPLGEIKLGVLTKEHARMVMLREYGVITQGELDAWVTRMRAEFGLPPLEQE